MRWLFASGFSVAVVLLLFVFLHWAVTPKIFVEPEAEASGPEITMVKVKPVEPEPEPEPEPELLPENTPPPPPDAPSAAPAPEMPGLEAPALMAMEVDAGPVVVNVNIDTSGLGVGAGALGDALRGGLAGSGTGLGGGNGNGQGAAGGGAGGNGDGAQRAAAYAKNRNFAGKRLIPLSTARPQMPEWACKQKIKGWIEVIYVIMPSGRVQDVEVIDANPKGVFEAAAIEAMNHWIYDASRKAREAKQRFEMDPEECVYNWH